MHHGSGRLRDQVFHGLHLEQDDARVNLVHGVFQLWPQGCAIKIGAYYEREDTVATLSGGRVNRRLISVAQFALMNVGNNAYHLTRLLLRAIGENDLLADGILIAEGYFR